VLEAFGRNAIRVQHGPDLRHERAGVMSAPPGCFIGTLENRCKQFAARQRSSCASFSLWVGGGEVAPKCGPMTRPLGLAPMEHIPAPDRSPAASTFASTRAAPHPAGPVVGRADRWGRCEYFGQTKAAPLSRECDACRAGCCDVRREEHRRGQRGTHPGDPNSPMPVFQTSVSPISITDDDTNSFSGFYSDKTCDDHFDMMEP
jgi:hypothetical protein